MSTGLRVSALVAAFGLLLAGAGCRSKPVAKVNDQVITKDDFFEALQSGRTNAPHAVTTLDSLVSRALVDQEAQKRKITINDQEMAEALAQHRLMFQGEWEPLLQAGLATEEDIITEVQFVIHLARFFIKEDELKAFFEAHKTQFDRPADVTFRRIGVKTKADADAVREQIVSGKATFDDMLSEHSAIKAEGGRLGPVPRGFAGRNKELEDVVFSLPLKQISQPIKVEVINPPNPEPQTEWQIVEVLARKPKIEATYANSWYLVMHQAVFSPEYGERVFGGLNQLKADADIQVFLPKYRELARQYQALKQGQPPRFAPPGKAEPAAPGKAAPPSKAPGKAAPAPGAPARAPAGAGGSGGE